MWDIEIILGVWDPPWSQEDDEDTYEGDGHEQG